MFYAFMENLFQHSGCPCQTKQNKNKAKALLCFGNDSGIYLKLYFVGARWQVFSSDMGSCVTVSCLLCGKQILRPEEAHRGFT